MSINELLFVREIEIARLRAHSDRNVRSAGTGASMSARVPAPTPAAAPVSPRKR